MQDLTFVQIKDQMIAQLNSIHTTFFYLFIVPKIIEALSIKKKGFRPTRQLTSTIRGSRKNRKMDTFDSHSFSLCGTLYSPPFGPSSSSRIFFIGPEAPMSSPAFLFTDAVPNDFPLPWS